jgi:hypothetical protein
MRSRTAGLAASHRHRRNVSLLLALLLLVWLATDARVPFEDFWLYQGLAWLLR